LAPPARQPKRRCIATGAVRDTAELVRFVVGPEVRLVPDVAGKLPGRGLWVTASKAAVERAVAKKLFQRAARCQVVVEADLADRVEQLLAARCLELLGLARRAGELVLGYEKVAALARAGKAAVLLAACDAAPGGRAKIQARARGVPTVELFAGGELSLALGRHNVVHAALCRGGLADRFRSEAVRLAGFRAERDDGDGTPDGGTAAGERVQ
jgi:hypothetical protein